MKDTSAIKRAKAKHEADLLHLRYQKILYSLMLNREKEYEIRMLREKAASYQLYQLYKKVSAGIKMIAQSRQSEPIKTVANAKKSIRRKQLASLKRKAMQLWMQGAQRNMQKAKAIGLIVKRMSHSQLAISFREYVEEVRFLKHLKGVEEEGRGLLEYQVRRSYNRN